MPSTIDYPLGLHTLEKILRAPMVLEYNCNCNCTVIPVVIALLCRRDYSGLFLMDRRMSRPMMTFKKQVGAPVPIAEVKDIVDPLDWLAKYCIIQ